MEAVYSTINIPWIWSSFRRKRVGVKINKCMYVGRWTVRCLLVSFIARMCSQHSEQPLPFTSLPGNFIFVAVVHYIF